MYPEQQLSTVGKPILALACILVWINSEIEAQISNNKLKQLKPLVVGDDAVSQSGPNDVIDYRRLVGPNEQLELDGYLNDLKKAAGEPLGSVAIANFTRIFVENHKRIGQDRRHFIVHKDLLPRATVTNIKETMKLDYFSQEKLSTTDEKNLVIFQNTTTIFCAIAATKYFHFRVSSLSIVIDAYSHS